MSFHCFVFLFFLLVCFLFVIYCVFVFFCFFFFFKQKTAYEIGTGDWSSDVCSSDLICIQNLPVFLALDRAGIVGVDGPTHQGMYDISYLRCIPNIVLMDRKSVV